MSKPFALHLLFSLLLLLLLLLRRNVRHHRLTSAASTMNLLVLLSSTTDDSTVLCKNSIVTAAAHRSSPRSHLGRSSLSSQPPSHPKFVPAPSSQSKPPPCFAPFRCSLAVAGSNRNRARRSTCHSTVSCVATTVVMSPFCLAAPPLQ